MREPVRRPRKRAAAARGRGDKRRSPAPVRRRGVRQVDVPERPGLPGDVEELAEDHLGAAGGGRPVDRPATGNVLRQRDPRPAVDHGLAHRRHGPRMVDVGPQVTPRVDPGQNPRDVGDEVVQGESDAIGGGSRDGQAIAAGGGDRDRARGSSRGGRSPTAARSARPRAAGRTARPPRATPPGRVHRSRRHWSGARSAARRSPSLQTQGRRARSRAGNGRRRPAAGSWGCASASRPRRREPDGRPGRSDWPLRGPAIAWSTPPWSSRGFPIPGRRAGGFPPGSSRWSPSSRAGRRASPHRP